MILVCVLAGSIAVGLLEISSNSVWMVLNKRKNSIGKHVCWVLCMFGHDSSLELSNMFLHGFFLCMAFFAWHVFAWHVFPWHVFAWHVFWLACFWQFCLHGFSFCMAVLLAGFFFKFCMAVLFCRAS